MARRGLCVLALAASMLVTGPAAAAGCVGDCNGDREVRIDELVGAVGIALGSVALTTCTAADDNNDGQVTIDELIAAVVAALAGCGGNLEELRAALSIAAAPVVTVLDFGNVGATGSGGSGLAGAARRAQQTRAELPGGPQGSGCFSGECFLAGVPTGFFEVCCLGTLYTELYGNCVYDDEDGAIIERDGFFSLETERGNPCDGTLPVGTSFFSVFEAYHIAITDPDGLYAVWTANFRESFDAAGGGCTAQQPDHLGFGIRGDGTRALDGSRRVILGNLEQGDVLDDVETRLGEVHLTVASTFAPNGCVVDAVLDGEVEVIDRGLGTDTVTTVRDFAVRQTPLRADAVQLEYQGTVATDCLGEVGLRTLAPLRVADSEACPTGGVVRATSAAGVVDITFTPEGGVRLDLDADGRVDESAARCNELTVDACAIEVPAALCARCDEARDCGALACGSCRFACSGTDLRCAPTDGVATCEDGIY